MFKIAWGGFFAVTKAHFNIKPLLTPEQALYRSALHPPQIEFNNRGVRLVYVPRSCNNLTETTPARDTADKPDPSHRVAGQIHKVRIAQSQNHTQGLTSHGPS